MRKTAIVTLVLTLAAGFMGFILRSAQLETVFDKVTGLAARGAPETARLIAVVTFFLIFAALLSAVLTAKCSAPRKYNEAFAPVSGIYTAIFCALGIIWLAATVMHVINIHSKGSFPAAEIYFSAFSAVSAVSVALLALLEYKNPSAGARFFFSVVPALFMCFWLILLYRENAANPVLLSFSFQCLAIIAAALGFYFTAGFVFGGKNPPGRTLLSYVTTVFFCCITLADKLSADIKMIYAVISVIALIQSVMLVKNLKLKTKEATGNNKTR